MSIECITFKWWVRVVHFVVVFCFSTLLVLCCYARYNFRIQSMLGTSLLPVVCSKDHVLFVLFALSGSTCA